MHTLKGSRINWLVMLGEPGADDYRCAYAADGDGMYQLVDYGDRVELLDQLTVIRTYGHADSIGDIEAMLRDAELYIAATNHALYEELIA